MNEFSPQDLQQGYRQDAQGFTCIHCGQTFYKGQVYPMDDRFFDAEGAARQHVTAAHGDPVDRLVMWDVRHNGLTAHQQQLMRLFYDGLSDREIAAAMGTSPATVRRQRFTFREKAKQARLYLAQYESVFGRGPKKEEDDIMPIHDTARQVDDRYVITEAERARILKGAFVSDQPLRLKALSPKEKKKVVILSRIAQQFQRGRDYSEAEVNDILLDVHTDFATLRRYLVEYGFMARTNDCTRYWLA